MKLTPNRRMAIFLQELSDDNAKDKISPLSTWLENLYSELLLKYEHDYPKRLEANEEIIIWENIIAESEVGQALFRVRGTARLAREAWILCKQWRIDQFQSEIQTENSRAYQEWARVYKALCHEKSWVDSATFVEVLLAAILEKKIEIPKEIILMGFEELTPQLSYFFTQIAKLGVKVEKTSLVAKQNQAKRIAAADSQEELRLAAFMAKRWLEASAGSKIGIVIPDLEQQRRRVVRIFEEFLPKGSFNVAAPIALNGYPLIASALAALRLLTDTGSFESFSQLLRSPFFKNASQESLIRMSLDAKLRERAEAEFSLNQQLKKIKYIFKAAPWLASTEWLQGLEKFASAQKEIAQKRSAAEWREKILSLLDILGWPGDLPLSTEEQEIKQQWYRLLTDYVNMSRVLSPHPFNKALDYLEHLAAEITFLPSTANCSVQILGMLEAVGIPFSYLWVTGLHREAWPLEPMPNPFIPIKLQRESNLPRSSAARELEMAKKFTARLCQGAREVVFSYPTLVNEQASTVSHLLRELPEVTKEYFEIPTPLSFFELQAQIREFTNKKERVGLEKNLSEVVFGGTRLLKLQSICPFWAFAEGRLQAHPLPPAKNLGLTGAERGEMIHEILQIFWEGITNQTQLQQLSEDALVERIKSCIEKIFEDWQLRYPQTLTPQYLLLEKDRTYQLIYQFIQLEKTRPYFEVVAREEESIIELEGLKFKIRIDRIDYLPHQGHLIIDYKTGEIKPKDWFGERLPDPQLPLYGVSHEPKAIGIACGLLRPEAVKFQGVAENETVLPGVKKVEALRAIGAESSWKEQGDSWEKQLKRLANDIKQGVAEVDPLEGAHTCRTCSLKALCRIHSRSDLESELAHHF